MTRSLIAVLAAFPFASAAFGADVAPAPIPTTAPAGLLGISETGWETNAELGIAGTSGNQDTTNIHAGLATLHTDEDGRTKGLLSYDHSINNGVVNQNRFVADATRDFFVFEKESKWGLYGNLRYEYNDFIAWNHQLSAFAGPSYRFMQDEAYTLIGRAGLGGRYKSHGPTDNGSFTPEAQFGADFTWKIDERQKFEAATTVYPGLKDGKAFRSITTAGYSLAIDATKSLKLSAEHDYDSSQTNPFRKSDMKYWVTLSMKL